MRIIQYPHPTLRHVSKPLKRVDAELRKLVQEMLALMYAAQGIGLAANQVRGVRWNEIPATGQATVELARAEWLLPVSESTVASIGKAIDDPGQEQLRQFRGATEAQIWAGLLLGSPEFQRH